MTNVELIEKKLAFIVTCLRQIEDKANLEEVKTNIKEERFVSHTLQIAIQATQDVSSHIVSELKLSEPQTNRELFQVLFKNGWISKELTETMTAIIGFRNIVVHGYETVDLDILKNIAENNLKDLYEFVENIRDKIKQTN